MKKIIITILASIMLGTTAFAGSVQIGTKVSTTFIEAEGNEKTTAGSVTGGAKNTNTASADNNVTLGSLYAEYSLGSDVWGSEGNEITFGYQYTFGEADVSDTLSSRTDTAEDDAGSGTSGTKTYSANAEVSDYSNYYIEMPVQGALFVKLGMSQIDVITREDADHHGSYGDTTLDGMNYGVGMKGLYGPLQLKLAYEVTDWDGLNLTSTTSNKITADLDTDELALSVAYRF